MNHVSDYLGLCVLSIGFSKVYVLYMLFISSIFDRIRPRIQYQHQSSDSLSHKSIAAGDINPAAELFQQGHLMAEFWAEISEKRVVQVGSSGGKGH